MTTVLSSNVHNIAIEGTFDDCQDQVKAMFADLAFRDAMNLVGGQLDQLGAHHGPDRLLLRRRDGAGRARPRHCLLRADRPTSATSSPPMPPGAWGCRWLSSSSAPTGTTSSPASSRPAA
jgi:hypothetical protein